MRRVLRHVRVDTWAGQLRYERWDKEGYCCSVEDPFDRWVLVPAVHAGGALVVPANVGSMYLALACCTHPGARWATRLGLHIAG